MKNWPIKSIVVVTIVFVLMFIFYISTTESQKNYIQNRGSIGTVLYAPIIPGAIVNLFTAPASCRDQVSSLPSYLSCPNIHYSELLISYLVYLIIVVFIAWIYRRIRNKNRVAI